MNRIILSLAFLSVSFAQNAQRQILLADTDAPVTPTDSPGGGSYGSTQSVTIADATAGFILYTTNGTTPSCPATGTLYSGAISVTVTTTIKAIGCNGVTGSGVLSSTYTITGASPTFVQGVGNFTGGGTLSITVTAGNHLVVWTVANDRTTGHTCSNNGTANTYVTDSANILGAASNAIIGNLAHVKTLAASATITITCTGTTPFVTAEEYSGGTGDLDTTSAGTSPSSSNSTTSPSTPSAFTPTTAATILVNGFGSISGGTITLTQVDGSYTTRASCLTGASCFVGAIGSRVVGSAASYSDGWTWSGTDQGQIAVNAAYK